MKQQFYFLGVGLMLASFSGTQAWAAALAHDDLTAAGAGAANAVVAGADDLSAAFYNPAGLAWQEGVQAMIGSQSRTKNINATVAGQSYEGDGSTPDLTTFAISWLPKGEILGAAASIATPYALNTNWGNAFPTQLGATSLVFQRYAVDAFWRLDNTLAVALGLDWYDTNVTLNNSTTSFSGSAWSKTAAHASLRWQFSPSWLLGIHFRQGADVDVVNGANAHVNIALPDELTLAVAHDLWDDEMRIELDVKRSNWSSFKNLNVVDNGVTSQSLPVNLKDTTDVALGAIWFWRQNTQLRFGYGYKQAANDLNSYQPAIGDQAGHRLSIGFGGMMSGMHLDMTYSGVISPAVNVAGNYAGKYNDTTTSMMFSLTKKF